MAAEQGGVNLQLAGVGLQIQLVGWETGNFLGGTEVPACRRSRGLGT